MGNWIELTNSKEVYINDSGICDGFVKTDCNLSRVPAYLYVSISGEAAVRCYDTLTLPQLKRRLETGKYFIF